MLHFCHFQQKLCKCPKTTRAYEFHFLLNYLSNDKFTCALAEVAFFHLCLRPSRKHYRTKPVLQRRCREERWRWREQRGEMEMERGERREERGERREERGERRDGDGENREERWRWRDGEEMKMERAGKKEQPEEDRGVIQAWGVSAQIMTK